jgi:hypothetical protein
VNSLITSIPDRHCRATVRSSVIGQSRKLLLTALRLKDGTDSDEPRGTGQTWNGTTSGSSFASEQLAKWHGIELSDETLRWEPKPRAAPPLRRGKPLRQQCYAECQAADSLWDLFNGEARPISLRKLTAIRSVHRCPDFFPVVFAYGALPSGSTTHSPGAISIPAMSSDPSRIRSCSWLAASRTR